MNAHAYDHLTNAELADIADQRMAEIPGCAVVPLLVAKLWPAWRVSDARRPRLIAALLRDDALFLVGPRQ